MSAFLTDLILVDMDGERWKVHEPLVYVSDILNGGKIVVPAGTITDLASIPCGLWNIAPKTGRFDAAATVHDWLYTQQTLPKEICDAVFHEAMLVKGVSKWRAWVMWKAVSWFGGGAWRMHTVELAADQRAKLDIQTILTK